MSSTSVPAGASDSPAVSGPLAARFTSSVQPIGSEIVLDVREELNNGGEPFSRIMAAVAALRDDEVLHLRAPFEPVPLFRVLEKRGFGHTVERHADDDWSVRFFRQDAPSTSVPQTTGGTAASAATPPTLKSAAPGKAERTEVWLDVRGLEPPEPMVRTLEALEVLPTDSVLVQVNMRVPQLLLPILRERGFHFTIDETQLQQVQVRIWRAA